MNGYSRYPIEGKAKCVECERYAVPLPPYNPSWEVILCGACYAVACWVED